jgi:hypothetical protein
MRSRLLLVAIGCVVGYAHPEEDFDDAFPKDARAFSEKPGAEPIALRRGRRVILRPIRVAFLIPQAWLDHYDSPPKDPDGYPTEDSPRNNLHFTRQELDQVRSGEGEEWDEMFAEVVNGLLPFEKCAFHGGGEGWGRQGHSFGDLQMRVYLGNWESGEIEKLVSQGGLSAVSGLSRQAFSQLSSRAAALKGFANIRGGNSPGASWDRSTVDGWQVESLTFPMRFYDYGATTVIDFYVRKYPRSTVVLVFMRTTFPGSQMAEMQEVVHSFRMRSQAGSSLDPSGRGPTGSAGASVDLSTRHR